MAQVVSLDYLKEFLIHEIKELARIKNALNLEEHVPAVDNLTLAAVPVRKGTPQDVARSIKEALRESDVIFVGSSYLILMLPGTDEMGAIHLLEGVSEFLGEGVKNFVYSLYPKDGTEADSLVEVLKERMRIQLNLSPEI